MWCWGPCMNKLPNVRWSTFMFIFLNHSGSISMTQSWGIFFWFFLFLVSIIHHLIPFSPTIFLSNWRSFYSETYFYTMYLALSLKIDVVSTFSYCVLTTSMAQLPIKWCLSHTRKHPKLSFNISININSNSVAGEKPCAVAPDSRPFTGSPITATCPGMPWGNLRWLHTEFVTYMLAWHKKN